MDKQTLNFTEHQATVNSVTFWYVATDVHKYDYQEIGQLKLKGFWEACLWGDRITLVRFGRI